MLHTVVLLLVMASWLAVGIALQHRAGGDGAGPLFGLLAEWRRA
jgi:hypothetical protein